jgi:hypothetical protein
MICRATIRSIHSQLCKGFIMISFIKKTCAIAIASALFAVSMPSRAQYGLSEASAYSTALPVAVVASVGAGASVAIGSSAVGVVAVPAALSVGGATLIVKSVEASATGIVCVLERASDGARVTLEIARRDAVRFGAQVGATVGVTVMLSGVVLVKAGEAVAYIPNALGRALTHNERL